MLSWVFHAFGRYWGPLRLFDSFFFLAAVGFATAAAATWILLPRLWNLLPRDRGRAFAVNAELSVGKPVSAGVIFIGVFAVVALLFVPFGLIFGAMVGEGLRIAIGPSRSKSASSDEAVDR